MAGIGEAMHRGALFGDFRAFWCAGSAVLHGANPYDGATLYACESTPQPFGLYIARDGIALPVPQPGYAIALFGVFALLPFPIAALFWCGALLASCIYTVRAMRALGVPDEAGAFAAFALPVALVALPFGELVPIAVAAACGCGLALRRGAWSAAVAWACIGMIEPHVGLPVLLVLVGLERTRMRAALAIVMLAALHALIARGEAVPYFTHVLPQHALAELPRATQYSLAWILYALGASPGIALGIGTVSYALALGAGISLGALLAQRRRAPELLALVPCACALAGGTFMHIAQMAVALPALLVLASNAAGVRAIALRSALFLLALPWSEAAGNALAVVLLAAAAAVVAATTLHLPVIRALYAALASATYAAIIAFASTSSGSYGAAMHVHLPSLDPSLAQASWGSWILAHDSIVNAATWLAKVPTWLGLGLAFIGFVLVAREERVARVGNDHAPTPSGA